MKRQGKYLGFDLGTDVDREAEYMNIVQKIEAHLRKWNGRAKLHLLDKIKIWNIYAMSKLGYIDQLLEIPMSIQKHLEKLLVKWIGGPNGWISAEALSRLKADLDFHIAPRKPGPANLAARSRTRQGLSNDGKRVMHSIRRTPLGHIADRSKKPCLVLYDTDARLHDIGTDRQTINNSLNDQHNVHTRGKKKSFQSEAYRIILNRWQHSNAQARNIAIRCSLSNSLNRHLRDNFRCGGRESAIRTGKWIDNFKVVVKLVPPRVAATLLRAGLHGGATHHRCGRQKTCNICQRYDDSLIHIVNCSSIRRIWHNVLPGIPFDGLDMLGFIHRDMHVNDRVLLSIILFWGV